MELLHCQRVEGEVGVLTAGIVAHQRARHSLQVVSVQQNLQMTRSFAKSLKGECAVDEKSMRILRVLSPCPSNKPGVRNLWVF